eukprot:Filipodium_phascolosomae@DN7986_c0_g1_i1.p2
MKDKNPSGSAAAVNFTKVGDQTYAHMEKMNSEVVSVMYGSLVSQLMKDIGDVEEVNTQLDKIGAAMGERLVDDFFAKSGLGSCADFTSTMEVVAKVGLRMYLGVTADVTKWSPSMRSCSLLIHENPLLDFVELPAALYQLRYSNVIAGVIRGALDQMHLKVECVVAKDPLKGDPHTEIRVDLKQVLSEQFIDDD